MGAERSLTRLRLVAAAVVAVAGGALVAGGAGTVGWLLVIVGWLAALGWLAIARGSRRRIRDRESYFLELDPGGLILALGAEPERTAWTEVEAIAADEDALCVRVERAGAEPLRVPLLWKGIGLHELAEAIDGARVEACSKPGGT